MVERKQVAIIGPFGEIGGVSIHIKRLTELLGDRYIFNIINESRTPRMDPGIVNFRKLPLRQYFGVIIKSDLVHIHSGKNLLVAFHLFAAFVTATKAIVTMHSYKNPSGLYNLLLKLLALKVIVVSKEIQQNSNLQHAIILNAFIPPISEQQQALSASILSLIKDQRQLGKFIITANAFRLAEYQGHDLYGLDQLITLAERFKINETKAVIIFFIASLVKHRDRYENFQRMIAQKDLADQIILVTETVPFIKVIQEADLVIRPTLTDGDALTIRESLYFHTPVIASDVVQRPNGCFLYKTGDVHELELTVNQVLKQKELPENDHSNLESYRETYLEIYEAGNTKL